MSVNNGSASRLLTDLSLEELRRALLATIAAAGSESGSAEAIRVAIAAKEADITAPENIVWRGDVEALRRALCDWMYEAAVPLIRTATKCRASAHQTVAINLSTHVLGCPIRLLVTIDFLKPCKTIAAGWQACSPEIGHHANRGWRKFTDNDKGMLQAECRIDTDHVNGYICCYTIDQVLLSPRST